MVPLSQPEETEVYRSFKQDPISGALSIYWQYGQVEFTECHSAEDVEHEGNPAFYCKWGNDSVLAASCVARVGDAQVSLPTLIWRSHSAIAGDGPTLRPVARRHAGGFLAVGLVGTYWAAYVLESPQRAVDFLPFGVRQFLPGIAFGS